LKKLPVDLENFKLNNESILTIKNYVLRIVALSFSSFSDYLVAVQCPSTETVRTKVAFLLVEAELVPVCGLFLSLPAPLPGDCLALKAAYELSVLSKCMTPAGKQTLAKELV